MARHVLHDRLERATDDPVALSSDLVVEVLVVVVELFLHVPCVVHVFVTLVVVVAHSAASRWSFLRHVFGRRASAAAAVTCFLGGLRSPASAVGLGCAAAALAWPRPRGSRGLRLHASLP